MRGILRGARGFTLVEALVGMGILAVVTSATGATLFQAFRTQGAVTMDGLAVNEVWKAMSWFGEDVKMAQTTDLADGAAPAASVTFSWTNAFEGAETPHSISYALVGERLVRTYDGSAHTIAHRALSATYSRSGRTVTAVFQVRARPGETRTLSVNAVMRSSP